MVPRRSDVASRFDVDLDHRRRQRRHHPAGGRQHDRGGRPPDGRDGRPPRRADRAAAGHPGRAWSREVVGWVKQPAPGLRDRADAGARAAPSPTRWRCCPSGRTARSSWSTTAGRSAWSPSADCAGADRFAQLSQVMSHPAAHAAGQASRPGRRSTCSAAEPPPAGPGGRRRRPAGRRADPDRGAARHPVRPGGGRGRAGCGSPRRSGSTATSRAKAERLLATGVDLLVMDTAHGHQQRMIEALAGGPLARPRASRWWPATWCRPRAPRALIEAGADIVKVGVGPGAMCTTRMMTGVGRPQFSAVLECAAGGAAARQARLGRRRRPAPARRRAGAGRRRVRGDDRFLVRRHLRVARRPAARRRTAAPTRTASGWPRPARWPTGRPAESAFDRARKALFEEGISTGRQYLDPARPGVEDLIDAIVAGVRSAFTYAGARTLAEFAERAVVGVQSAPATPRAGRCTPAGDRGDELGPVSAR